MRLSQVFMISALFGEDVVTMDKILSFFKKYVRERESIVNVLKNYDDEKK